MADTSMAVRVAGTWLAVASLLMVATFLLHGPIAPDHGDQMKRIADNATRWAVAHWIAAAALSLYALTGLVVLSSASRLTEGWWTMTSWAALPVSALWTMTTAVAEATVVASAATSMNMDVFAAWWAFAEGKATGFAFLALAVAGIAENEARSPDRAVPAWCSRIALIAALASFAGWGLGMWFGVALGNLLWLGSSIMMCLWTLWLGIALRSRPGRLGVSNLEVTRRSA